MAQKHYGVIPKDKSLVGYGGSERVRAKKKKRSFAGRMVDRLMKWRKSKKNPAKTGYKQAGKDVRDAMIARKKRMEDASK